MTNSDKNSNREDFFGTGEVRATLGRKSVLGGAMTGGGQAVKFLLLTLSNVVLARLLSPDEFGLVAMVAAITGPIYTIRDLGLTSATIQRREVTHAQASTLFWINLLFSLTIMGMVTVAAPFLAHWYQREEVRTIAIWLAISFFPVGLTAQHRAILARQMKFGRIATIEIGSLALGVAGAIVAAALGAGYRALVYYQLIIGLTTGIGIWAMSGWMPGLPQRHSGVKSMVGFGGRMTIFNVINQFGRNLDQILVGRFIGAVSLGYYERAQRLVVLPLRQVQTPLNFIALPTLSRLLDEPERYRRYYTRAVRIIGQLMAPLLTLTVVMAHELIAVALGPGWEKTADLFAILGISAITSSFTTTSGWILTSQGRMKEMLVMGYITTISGAIAIAIGLNWGLTAVAWAVVIHQTLIRMPVMFWFAGRRGPVSVTDMWKTLTLPLMTSAVVAAVTLTFHSWGRFGSPVLDLLSATGLTAVVVFLTLRITPQGRTTWREIRGIFRTLSGRE